MRDEWQRHSAIMRLLEEYGLLLLEPEKYDALNRKLLEILEL
jgi:hypothetical protein